MKKVAHCWRSLILPSKKRIVLHPVMWFVRQSTKEVTYLQTGAVSALVYQGRLFLKKYMPIPHILTIWCTWTIIRMLCCNTHIFQWGGIGWQKNHFPKWITACFSGYRIFSGLCHSIPLTCWSILFDIKGLNLNTKDLFPNASLCNFPKHHGIETFTQCPIVPR